MKVGDLVKKAGSLGDYATNRELEYFHRLGVLLELDYEPFPETGVWSILWQDGEVSSGHWGSDLELIR